MDDFERNFIAGICIGIVFTYALFWYGDKLDEIQHARYEEAFEEGYTAALVDGKTTTK